MENPIVNSTFKVAVLGAGFSGLSLAWQLQKRGAQVEIFEKSSAVGGLIQTRTDPVLVESAAHAFLSSGPIEELFQDLGVQIAVAGHRSKKKWIFRARPRRWPLTVVETLTNLPKLFFARLLGAWSPQALETVSAWAQRRAGRSFDEMLLGPALQGVYGAPTSQLSASLVIGAMSTTTFRPQRGQHRGSIAPWGGMQEIIQALVRKLEQNGTRIHLERSESIASLHQHFDAVVVATSSRAAADLLKDICPRLSADLWELPRVSLSSVTVRVPAESRSFHGFGCLFPRSENFHSLGVLFNTDLFANRGPGESETWIFGNACEGVEESTLEAKIKQDRQRLGCQTSSLEIVGLHRWPGALPLYGIELEKFLQSDDFVRETGSHGFSCLELAEKGARIRKSAKPVYLTGNYLGVIGLTKIHSYNERLANRVCQDRESRDS